MKEHLKGLPDFGGENQSPPSLLLNAIVQFAILNIQLAPTRHPWCSGHWSVPEQLMQPQPTADVSSMWTELWFEFSATKMIQASPEHLIFL